MGLIDQFVMPEESFEKRLAASSPEKSIEQIRRNMKLRIHDNIHDYMQDGGWFRQMSLLDQLGELEKRENGRLSYPSQGKGLAGLDVSYQKTVVRAGPKIGRNDPCSCGSGKKYKKCCLQCSVQSYC